MENLVYESFVWPRNPDTYQENWSRDGVYHKNDLGDDVFDGLSMRKCIITGTGVFLGEEAFEDYRLLLSLFNQPTPGNLEHPKLGFRYCYFTGFEVTQEPVENCVHYKFTFEVAEQNGDLPK